MNYKAKTLIPILGVVLVGGYVALFTDWIDKSRKSPAAAAEAAIRTADSFAGGSFEASGIAHVAGTDGFLFVDDARPDEVLWIQLDKDGKQHGSITPVKLGIDIDDPEGITTMARTSTWLVRSRAKRAMIMPVWLGFDSTRKLKARRKCNL
jgi:hypothetical protein